MEFNHLGATYNVVHIPESTRIRLWVNYNQGSGWEFGHAKELGDKTPGQAATLMQRFITGDINHDEYNRELPGP